jgi:hypothetical protein
MWKDLIQETKCVLEDRKQCQLKISKMVAAFEKLNVSEEIIKA